MPKVSSAYSTYDAKGNREDLSNAIYNIDPFDVPMLSAARRRNVKSRTFDWQTEHLPTVDVDNAQVEGFELQRTASQPTIRMSNVAQISKRDATVTGSQQESDAAGKGNEMAHQMALKSKVLKSDIEAILGSRQARNDGDDTNPRRTEGFAHSLARAKSRDNVQGAAVFGVTDDLPLDADDPFLPVAAGDQVVFSEQMLGDGMERAYENGASPSMLIVPPSIKRGISAFEGRSSSQVMVGKNEVVATVDIIATDFGRIKVLPSRWIAKDLAFLIDPNYIAVGFFRNFRQFPLAKIGDAETRMILAEWGVENRNPMAHLLFNGIKRGAVIGG